MSVRQRLALRSDIEIWTTKEEINVRCNRIREKKRKD